MIYGCFHTQSAELNLITSLLPVFLLSLGLLLDFSFQHTLVQVPPSTNPVRLIFKVLKYAAKHKRAAQRSAFTYCENEEPGRDYGKSKYGGPFTTEQVEDVKTFWRVLTVIAVIVAFYCPLQPLFESHVDLEKHFSPIEVDSECVEGVLHGAISPFSLMAYSVPVYEFFVYPCLKGTPGILESVGIEAALVNIASIYGVMVETVRETLDSNGTQCMFSDETWNREIETNSLLIIIPYHFIVGFSIYGLYKSSIEFVCAQAPYNMTGLLIGLLYMLMSLVRALGTLLYIAAKKKSLNSSTCGIWFYLMILVTTFFLSVLPSLVIHKYKARERDEIAGSQIQVEDVYYKYYKRENRREKNRHFSLPIVYQL